MGPLSFRSGHPLSDRKAEAALVSQWVWHEQPTGAAARELNYPLRATCFQNAQLLT